MRAVPCAVRSSGSAPPHSLDVLRLLVPQPFVLIDEGVAMEDALLRHPFRARNRAEPILLRCGRVVHAPKFTHARDYTGLRRLTFRRRCAPMLPAAAPCSHACCRIPGRQSFLPSAAWVARRYGSMVFMMFDPVAPVNTGTSVTGIGCVFARPATNRCCPPPRAASAGGCRSPARGPDSGVRSWRMWSDPSARRRRSE